MNRNDCLLVNYLLCKITFVLSDKSNSLQVKSTQKSNEVTVLRYNPTLTTVPLVSGKKEVH